VRIFDVTPIVGQKAFGGTLVEYGRAVDQTADGGFIMVGTTYSFGLGNNDMYAVRTDKDGDTIWSKSYGGSSSDNGYDCKATPDGGFIFSGATNSFGSGSWDAYVIKTDANGDTLWTNTYGKNQGEHAYSISLTDNGYIFTGYKAVGSDLDMLLIRLDFDGNILWERTYGEGDYDIGNDVMQTSDGGFIITGYRIIFGNYRDLYMVKTNSAGTILWSKTYGGGTGSSEGNGVKETTDGGYIATGYTKAFGAGGEDVYVVRTDMNGNLIWSRAFGGIADDSGQDIIETLDAGFAIVGVTNSFGAGNQDFYLIKLDMLGNYKWSKAYGGLGNDDASGFVQTIDNGFAIAGSTVSFGAGNSDLMLVKPDGFGNVTCNVSNANTAVETASTVVTTRFPTTATIGVVDLNNTTTTAGVALDISSPVCIFNTLEFADTVRFQKTLGGVLNDDGQSIQQTSDGGYIILGRVGEFTTADIYLIKTDNQGVVQWSKTYGGADDDYGISVRQTSDGGFIIAGHTQSFGAGGDDLYLLKVDALGTLLWSKTYGGTGQDKGLSAIQTLDGGYIITGYTISFGTDWPLYIVKTNSVGTVVWTKTFDLGALAQNATWIEQTTDGGYIITGYSAGCNDAIPLIKINSTGVITWVKKYEGGGCQDDRGWAVVQTSDGGYIIAGSISSIGAGGLDACLIKTNSIGDTLWVRAYGGSGNETAYEVHQTSDGGYILAGSTSSFGGGSYDAYLVRTTGNGDLVWSKAFGGTGSESASAVQETDLGGFVLIGSTTTFGAGGDDIYFIKTDEDGNSGGCFEVDAATIVTREVGTVAVPVPVISSGATTTTPLTSSAPIGTTEGELSMKASLAGINVSCNGGSDGSINLTMTGGNQPLTYLWANGPTTEDISSLLSGTYSVIVTDANGCTKNDTLIITEPPLLTTGIAKTDVTCYGGNDGTASAIPVGGTIPYNYLWNTGQTDSMAIGLFPGNYSVNVFDANGCLANNIITINEPAVPTISITGSNVTCIGGTNGAADLTVNGGTLPYIYAWSNLATTEDILAVSSGIYTVTVTDNCSIAFIDSIEITEPTAISIAITATNISCNGFADGIADLTVGGGTLPYTFAWSNLATTEDISGLSPASYGVTVTDNCGIIKSDLIVISEPGVLTASMSKTDVACFGGGDGTATITVGGGTGPFNYVWNTGQTTSTAVALFPGTYSVNVFDNNGCLASNAITVNEPVAPSSSTIGTNVSCIGGSNGAGNLTASGGTLPYTYAWSNTATTEDISGVTSGSYVVTITDACSIIVIDSVIITEPPAIIISIIGTNVSCNGFGDGNADMSVTGGTPPYTYAWSNLATTEDISGLTPATYNVTVTDACAIFTTDAIVITESVLLTSAISKVDVGCFGGGDGSATVVASGGTAPYNYVWNTGQTTSTANGLFAGSYSVNVFDLNGCLASNSILVGQPSEFSIGLSASYVSCNSGSDGAVDLTVTGGTIPFTYLWSNAATTEDVTGLTSGTYTVMVTDNCGAILSDSIAITQPGAINTVLVGNSVSCNGGSNGSIDLTPSQGVIPYTYLWSNGAITQDVSGLVIGTYTVTVTDSCGLTAIDAIAISEPLILTSSISKTDVVCNGAFDGTATIIASGGTIPYVYFWSNNQTTSTAVGLFTGNYTVNVIDFNGCLASNFINIIQPTALSGSVNGIDATCNGGNNGSADLSTSGGTAPFTYLWSNSASTEDILGIAAGNYSVTVTDSCSATYVGSISITEPSPISSGILISNVSCNGNADGSADLSVSGGTIPYSYMWSTTESTQDIASMDTGIYTVNITDACSAVLVDTATVTEPAILTTVMTKVDVTCFGGGDGTATVTPSGGTSPYNYLWNNGQVTANAVGLFPNNYTVNVTDANGCLASGIISIIQPPTLTADISSSTNVTCVGSATGSAVVSTTGGTPFYNYLWDDVGAQTSDTAFGLTAGTYIVLVTDSCGASTSKAITITEPPTMSLLLTQTNVSCNGYMDGSAVANITGGTAPFTYLWPLTSDSTSSVASLDTGLHILIVTSSCGNIITDSITITELPVLTTSMGSTDVTCFGGGNGTATVTALGGISPYNFLWSSGQTNATAIGLFPGNYTVNVTDLNGCLTSDIVIITQPTQFVAVTSSTDVSCLVGNNGTASVVAGGGTLPYSYLWSPSGDTTAVAVGLIEDTYTITLMDSCGATIVDSVVVGGPSSMSISLAATNVSCNGFNDGSIDLTIGSGTPPLSFLWSNSSTTEDVSGLSPGLYSVIVTDSCGTALSDSLIISEPASLASNMASVDISCNGSGDGSASVTASGGTIPYNYSWNNGQTQSTAIGLFQGNYSVNVIDVNGCLASDLITITEPNAINIVLSITDASCNIADGSISADVSGGLSPYVYNWSSGGTTSNEAALFGGNYSLQIADSNGCLDSANATVPISAIIQEICIVTVDSTSTKNEIVWEKPVVSNIDSFKIYRDILGVYTWVGSNPYLVESFFVDSTNNINPKITSYRYKISVLDACGNESLMSNYHETMHLQITYNGGIAQLSWDPYEGFDTSTFNYTILRDSMGTGIYDSIGSVTNNNTTYNDINSPLNADYLVEVVHPFGGCTADKIKNYNSSKSNTSSISGTGGLFSGTTTSTNTSQTVCDGTATVIPSGGKTPYTYQWDGNTGNQTAATATSLCAGTYSVIVYDASGNMVTLFATVSTVLGFLDVEDGTNILSVYPNPYSGKTKLSYTINSNALVLLEVYNLLGEVVETIISQEQQTGTYQYYFSAAEKGYSNGVYFVKLTANEYTFVKRIVEMK